MVYGGLDDASSVWEKFGDDFCDGLTYTISQKRLFCDPSTLDYGLFLIHKDLLNEEVEHDQGHLAKYNLPNFPGPSKLIYSSTGFLSHSIHRVIEFSIRPFLNFSHIYSSQRRLVMYWAIPASHHNSPYLIKLTIKSFAPPESGSHGNGK